MRKMRKKLMSAVLASFMAMQIVSPVVAYADDGTLSESLTISDDSGIDAGQAVLVTDLTESLSETADSEIGGGAETQPLTVVKELKQVLPRLSFPNLMKMSPNQRRVRR